VDSTDTSKFLYDASDKATLVKELNVKVEDLILKIKKNHNFNKGYLERLKLTKQSKQRMFLPLSRLFDFCKDINKVFSISIIEC
jgi:hypothetical protein